MKTDDLGIETIVTQNKRPARTLNQKRTSSEDESNTPKKYVAPSRKGKKPIIAHIPDYARTALKIFCMERGMSVEKFLIEAADEKLMNMGADFNIGEAAPMEKE